MSVNIDTVLTQGRAVSISNRWKLFRRDLCRVCLCSDLESWIDGGEREKFPRVINSIIHRQMGSIWLDWEGGINLAGQNEHQSHPNKCIACCTISAEL